MIKTRKRCAAKLWSSWGRSFFFLSAAFFAAGVGSFSLPDETWLDMARQWPSFHLLEAPGKTPGVSMTLKTWGHDPFILGNDPICLRVMET